jgi:hypothetical protein
MLNEDADQGPTLAIVRTIRKFDEHIRFASPPVADQEFLTCWSHPVEVKAVDEIGNARMEKLA